MVLLAVLAALTLTINSAYMFNIKLKYSKINWDLEVGKDQVKKDAEGKSVKSPKYPKLRTVRNFLHQNGKAGISIWNQFKSLWYAGCHTTAALFFRFAQIIVLLFTAQVRIRPCPVLLVSRRPHGEQAKRLPPSWNAGRRTVSALPRDRICRVARRFIYHPDDVWDRWRCRRVHLTHSRC